MEKAEIIHLARLARIAITDEEAEKMRVSIDDVLAYVSVIKDIAGDTVEKKPGALVNVFRADEVTNSADEFTEVLLAEAPKRKGRFLSVKKILNAE